MKIQTLLVKLFGKECVMDMMNTLDDDATEVEFYSVDESEDDCEPSYFVRVFSSSYRVTTINGEVLHESTDINEFKQYLKKVLAK